MSERVGRPGNDGRKAAGINVGSASIIMVFAVLCLTIFSVLTLVTARNDLALTESYARSVASYYAADTRAIAIYNQLAAGDAVFDEDIELSRAPAGGGSLISYSVPIDSGQNLNVLLEETPAGLRIAEWLVAEKEDWEFDDTLPIWDGELPGQ
ncbi:MAG: hypothetical protein LBK98_10385 [Peptococcaceae bacterium]|jgi:hypothetical protein|nr:hypothetical protein [Peptococcaceae bacterium]